MPKRYTVRNNETGQVVTFDWHGDQAPTDADMEEVFAASKSAKPANFSPVKDAIYNAAPFGLGKIARGLAEGGARPIENAPMIAGMAGEAFFGPPGAAVAGAGGSAVRDLYNAAFTDTPTARTAGDVAKNMGKEAAIQGGLSVGGRVAGAGLRKLGRGVYNLALRPAVGLTEKYGDIAATGLREGAPVMRSAVEPAFDAMRASKAAATQAVEQAGATVPRGEIVRGLRPVAAEMRTLAQAGEASDLPRLGGRIKRFVAKHPADIPATRVHSEQRALNAVADPAFNAARKGMAPRSPKAEIAKGFASSMGNALETAVPGLKAMNARTMERMGLAKALKKAADRPHGLTRNLAIGGGAGAMGGLLAAGPEGGAVGGAGGATGGLAAYAAMSPALQSLAAIGLDRTGRLPLSQLSRLAILAALSEEQP